MPVINSIEFKKLHNIDPKKSLTLNEISQLSGMPFDALVEVFNKGKGAFYSNHASVRKQVNSAEQWGYARVYSFVMKRKSTFGKADLHIAIKYYLA